MIFICIFIFFLAFNLVIVASRYRKTNTFESLRRKKTQSREHDVSDGICSVYSTSELLTSCPLQFRTRQPLFMWPPRPMCDMKCAISGLHKALPTAPWFDKMYKQFFNFSDSRIAEKWFNLDVQLAPAAKRLISEKLFPSTKQEFVLDIGNGFGYFSFFAGHFNHCVIGIDRCFKSAREPQLYRNASIVLGVDVRQHEIIPMKPFPIDLFDGVKFDVITVNLGWFHCQPRIWLMQEWDFFLTDLAIHHTTDDARAYFDMNRCSDDGSNVDSLWRKTVDLLEAKGVKFIGHQYSTHFEIISLDAFRN
jgi:SAM-dependent methyltransferase